MHNNAATIDIDAWDHNGSNDVREPPPGVSHSDQLPGTEDDVDPEDGGGRIEKHTRPGWAD